MNIKKTYEQLITQKLEEQLPIPDMADAIWARIEVQLDTNIDAEPSNSADNITQVVKQVSIKTAAIVLSGIVSLIVLFFIIKKSVKRKNDNKEQPRIEKRNTINNTTVLTDSVDQPTSKFMPTTPNNTSSIKAPMMLDADDAIIPKRDSLLNLLVPKIVKDTPQNVVLPPNIVLPADSLSPIPPLKKPRGVQVGNEGYRIQSVKKDSTNNK